MKGRHQYRFIVFTAAILVLIYLSGVLALHHRSRQLQACIRDAEVNTAIIREWDTTWATMQLLHTRQVADYATVEIGSLHKSFANLSKLKVMAEMPDTIKRSIAGFKGLQGYAVQKLNDLNAPSFDASQKQAKLVSLRPVLAKMVVESDAILLAQNQWQSYLRNRLDVILNRRLIISVGGFAIAMLLLCLVLIRQLTTRDTLKGVFSQLDVTERRYRYLVEESGFVTALVDKNGIFTYVSQPIEWITGFSPQDLVGKSWTDWITADSQPLAKELAAKPDAARSQRKIELQVVCKNNNPRWMSAQLFPLRDSEGKLTETQVVLWDIQNEVLARQEKLAHQQLVQGLLDKLPAGIFVFDVNRRIYMINQYLADYLQISPENILGRPVDLLRDMLNEGNNITCFDQVMKDQMPHSCNVWIKAPNKNRRFMQVTSYPLYDSSGEFQFVAAIANDLTESKNNAEELEAARRIAEEAKKAQELFMANIGHEIRTPLNGVLGMTHLLLRSPLDEEKLGYVETIHECSLSLVSLINDLLDFSKINSGQFALENTAFQPARSLQKAVRPFLVQARDKGIELKYQATSDLPAWLMGDSLRLEQIVINLVSNAVKFTQEGSVSVEFQSIPKNDSEVTLVITVADTGIGIPADRQEQIFDAFVQSTPSSQRLFGGTGLGLAIIRQLVSLQNGTIQLQSTPGTGSVFSVSIPFQLATSAQVPELVEEDEMQPYLNHIKVLLVDDNSINRKVAEILLRNQGAEVHTASNGLEAVDYLSNHAADIVLMDIHMPLMNGYDAARKIREDLKLPIPILALTADALTDEMEKCQAAGMQGFVTKPFDPKTLFQQINQQMGRVTKNLADTTSFEEDNWYAQQMDNTVSLEVLESMADGDPEYITEILRLFCQTMPEYADELQQHYQAKDAVRLSETAHKMKSSLGIIKIGNSQQLVEKLEIAFRTGEWNQHLADEWVPAIVGAINAAEPQLAERLHYFTNQIAA